MNPHLYRQIDSWVDAHFDQQVSFLQSLVRQPTDTPPGNNTPHAELTAQLLDAMGFDTEKHAVPDQDVRAAGLQSITNLVVRHRFGDGLVVGLNAHGDVVPPGEGWSVDPYGGDIIDNKLFGRAAAVSKSDFATYTFALRALEAIDTPDTLLTGAVELYFTYDEEFGGELGPGWLLRNAIVKPDLLVAAGFSYQVITGHSGCLQLSVTIEGKMGHAAVPDTGIDALAATNQILTALYERNIHYRTIVSKVEGISHPYVNVGWIQGGVNTNVVPGKVQFKLDRRMIPEEDPSQVEDDLRQLIATIAGKCPGITIQIERIMLARALKPLEANLTVVQALCRHASELFGEPVQACGTPLYTDARLFNEHGIPSVLYGCGPHTVAQSNAKRADEHIDLDDLRRATKVVGRTLSDLLAKKA